MVYPLIQDINPEDHGEMLDGDDQITKVRSNSYLIKDMKTTYNLTCAEYVLEYNYHNSKYTFMVINITHCNIIFEKKVEVKNLEDHSAEQS